ncbi:class II aldolase/adducin family protein [Haloferula sargassicola]|uniref:Methylthioribulose-1-phosphate dehydratase n=1 Tax=Haloferula sargassicola TaxID=490096 RepID=A0ABP9USY6_9BACT
MESSWLHPREELVRTMARIYRYNMTTTSGGNLSIHDPDGSIWITPSRLDKGRLRASDMVQVFPDGSREGTVAPSSEFPFHKAIYRRRPDIRAVVHAHPGALVAYSICRQMPDLRVQSHAYEVCRKIAYADYAPPGSDELGDNIADAFAGGADCVMLENHGVVVGGSDLQDAFQRFETLEFVARTLIHAHRLGSITSVPTEILRHPPRAEFGVLVDRAPCNRERELRGAICDFVRRSYEKRLLISTAGAFSARLDGNEFVVTPHRRDRMEIERDKLVRTRGGSCEAGGQPSRAALLHARIYERHPDVGAVILAQPAAASAYCVSSAELSTRTIPESYLVLLDAPKVPFSCIVNDADALADHIDLKRRPVILIQNEGALIVGRDLLDAFDRLEVLEATAEALQLSQSLGELVPMPDQALAELREAFGMDE